LFCQPSGSRRGPGRECWGGSVTVISMQCFFGSRVKAGGGGSERECWGGSVTVISMRESGREYWGGSVTVISIRLCVLSAMWKQEGVREEIMGWECNCY